MAKQYEQNALIQQIEWALAVPIGKLDPTSAYFVRAAITIGWHHLRRADHKYAAQIYAVSRKYQPGRAVALMETSGEFPTNLADEDEWCLVVDDHFIERCAVLAVAYNMITGPGGQF